MRIKEDLWFYLQTSPTIAKSIIKLNEETKRPKKQTTKITFGLFPSILLHQETEILIKLILPAKISIYISYSNDFKSEYKEKKDKTDPIEVVEFRLNVHWKYMNKIDFQNNNITVTKIKYKKTNAKVNWFSYILLSPYSKLGEMRLIRGKSADLFTMENTSILRTSTNLSFWGVVFV